MPPTDVETPTDLTDLDVMHMPRYRCHKVVHALEIVNISSVVIRDGELASALLHFREHPALRPDKKYFERNKPAVGGFFVLYQDGYRSYSPREAFLDGYTRIETLDQQRTPEVADRV